MIFLTLAWTLKEEALAREGRPLAAAFSTEKGDGFRLTEAAITDAAICAQVALSLRLLRLPSAAAYPFSHNNSSGPVRFLI